jgi:hypothetical protein
LASLGAKRGVILGRVLSGACKVKIFLKLLLETLFLEGEENSFPGRGRKLFSWKGKKTRKSRQAGGTQQAQTSPLTWPPYSFLLALAAALKLLASTYI